MVQTSLTCIETAVVSGAMRIPHPPKTPFRLALYSLAWFILISLGLGLLLTAFGYDLAQVSPGTAETLLFFGAMGYAYGYVHGHKLSFGKAVLTLVYFIIPLLVLRLIPTIPQITQEIPAEEKFLAVLLGLGIVAGVVGIQTLVFASACSFLSMIAAKNKNGTLMETQRKK